MQATSPVTNSWEVHDAALKLAGAIKALPEWQELQDARNHFRTDPGMTAIMARYRQVFGLWTAARKRGQPLAGPDATKLAECQLELENHPAFLRQHQATAALVSRLQAINQVLSAELGLDFSANAAPRGSGCCG